MIVCPNCHAENSSSRASCTECGTRLPSMSPSEKAQRQEAARTEPMSMGSWIGVHLINLIPIVGFIVLIVWAASDKTNVNRKNYAKALLLVDLVILVLYYVFGRFDFYPTLY